MNKANHRIRTIILTNHQLPPIAFPLASKFYKLHKKGKVSGSDIVWVSRDSGHIIAAARLSLVLPHYRLLTGVFVAPEYRKQGVARDLLQSTCDEPQFIYTFSLQHLQPFYQQLNFELIALDNLPCELAQMFIAYLKQGRKIVAMIRKNNN